MTAAPELVHVVRRWRRDPVFFARTMLGVETLWDRQRQILEAIRDHRRVAVPSCHESGKTFVASVAVVQHLLAHQPSKVITTAPTQRQVRDLLWSEIRSRFAGMVRKLGGDPGIGTPSLTHWEIDADWFATGFATSPDKAQDSAVRMSGYHSGSLLVVLDEAAGIPREVWASVDSLLTSASAKVLAIGNPASGTEFERVCKSPDWRVIPISAFDCPNLQPGAEQMAWGVTPRWVEEMARRWGKDSVVYQSKVLGRFPTSSDDTLISIGEVEDALSRRAPEGSSGLLSMGVDVARFGRDQTVIYVVQGGRVLRVESFSGQDLMRTTGRVLALAREFRISDSRIAIDDTGVGGGVVDRLREQRCRPKAVNFGSSATGYDDERRFSNRRTQIWWQLREWIRFEAALGDLRGEIQDQLRSDLCAPRYEQRSDGRIALEPKDKIRQRTGASPDHGDALALAIAATHQTSCWIVA